MRRIRALTLAMVAATGVTAATPVTALTTYVNFSFTAGGTAAKGVYALDCSIGGGVCAIVAPSGTFGATPISLASPPYPQGAPTPDDLVTIPGYEPTANGADFWPAPVGGPDDWRIWKAIGDQLTLEHDYSTYVQQYLVTDYTTGVPEPASWAMILVGFGALGAMRRFSRRKASVRAA